MVVKAFELRDCGTCMPALAIKMEASNEAEAWLLRRAGYSPDKPALVLVGHMEGGVYHYDEYETQTSTRRTAIPYIREHFDELESGSVICTEFIRGERTEPKTSERLDGP